MELGIINVTKGKEIFGDRNREILHRLGQMLFNQKMTSSFKRMWYFIIISLYIVLLLQLSLRPLILNGTPRVIEEHIGWKNIPAFSLRGIVVEMQFLVLKQKNKAAFTRVAGIIAMFQVHQNHFC